MAPKKRQDGEKGKTVAEKRKVRGVNARIQPREEKDRPVLRIAAPSFFDAGGDENAVLPRVVSDIVRSQYPGPYSSFYDYPENVRTLCWKDFQLYYKFPLGTDMTAAEKVFGRIAQTRLQDMLYKAKVAARKNTKARASMIGKQEVHHRLIRGLRRNISRDYATIGAPKSLLKGLEQILPIGRPQEKEKSNNRPPSIIELFDECHTSRKTGDYITKKAKDTREMYDKKVVEEYGEDPSTHPEFDAKLWEEVIGPNRHGDCYGQGVLGKLHVSSEGSDAASGAMPTQISEVELDEMAKRVTDKLMERISSDDLMTQRVMDRVMDRLGSDAFSKILDKKIEKKVEKVKKNLEKKYKKKEKKNLKKALRQSLASRDSQLEVGLTSKQVSSSTMDTIVSDTSDDSLSASSDDSSN